MAGSREAEELLGQEDPQLSRGGGKTDIHSLGTKAWLLGACTRGVLLFVCSISLRMWAV